MSLRTMLSFQVLRAAVLCVRGSRRPWSQNTSKLSSDFGLSLFEAGLKGQMAGFFRIFVMFLYFLRVFIDLFSSDFYFQIYSDRFIFGFHKTILPNQQMSINCLVQCPCNSLWAYHSTPGHVIWGSCDMRVQSQHSAANQGRAVQALMSGAGEGLNQAWVIK